MNNIAFIQGRLVNKVDDRIQAFPRDDWQKELELASKHNFNFIELTVDLDRIWENPISSSIGIDNLKNHLLEYEVKPIACTADFIMHSPPWDDLDNMTKITKIIIKNLGKINCKYIVIPFVDNSKIDKHMEDNAVKFLMSLKSSLVESNVEVAIESDYCPAELERFINRLPSKLFGINYDIGNSAALGYDVKEEFSSYFKRIKHIHVKDRVLNGTTVPLGRGNANFELCFSLLNKYNYKGDFSMQTARDKENKHVEVMLKYMDMVNSFLNAKS